MVSSVAPLVGDRSSLKGGVRPLLVLALHLRNVCGYLSTMLPIGYPRGQAPRDGSAMENADVLRLARLRGVIADRGTFYISAPLVALIRRT